MDIAIYMQLATMVWGSEYERLLSLAKEGRAFVMIAEYVTQIEEVGM